jgi:hypothetical protein
VQASILLGFPALPAAVVLVATYFSQSKRAPRTEPEDVEEYGFEGKEALDGDKQLGLMGTLRSNPEYVGVLFGTAGTWCEWRRSARRARAHPRALVPLPLTPPTHTF